MLVLNDTLISAKMVRTVATLFESIADLTFPKPRLAQMIARETPEADFSRRVTIEFHVH